jgi:nucleoside-diphosphate-sugar epimerase
MKILILGSEGFIGNHLVRYFLDHQFDVTGCDLIESSSTEYAYHKISLLSADVEDIFIGQKYDVCINAAGSGNVPYSITHPLSDFDANVSAVIHILDAIRKFSGACRYLHISSAAVYGNPVSLPVMETQPLKPVSPYGYHKCMSEMICEEYHNIFKSRLAVIRPFSVYGEGQKKQLLWDICKKLQGADQITLFGTGAESRDFIHIKDMAALIHLIIDQDKFEGQVFNAASGKETTIREIANLFMANFQNKNILFSGEVRKGDPLNWRADISAIAQMGYVPTIDLNEGIKKYIHWFEQSC